MLCCHPMIDGVVVVVCGVCVCVCVGSKGCAAYLEHNHMTVCDSGAVSTAQGHSGVAPCGYPCCPMSAAL